MWLCLEIPEKVRPVLPTEMLLLSTSVPSTAATVYLSLSWTGVYLRSPHQASHQNSLTVTRVLTPRSVKVALDMMYLSSSPDMRLAFNSLCGFASVNHLHFHLYYQSHRLPVQTAALTLLKDNLFVMTEEEYPAPAWVWLLDREDTAQILSTAENVVKLTMWLSHQETAHNVFITRSVCLSVCCLVKILTVRGSSWSGETAGDDKYIRVIVWAREAVRGAKVIVEISNFTLF